MTHTDWVNSPWGGFAKHYFRRCCPMIRDDFFNGHKNPETWNPPAVYIGFVLPNAVGTVPNVPTKDGKGLQQYVHYNSDGTVVVYVRAHKQWGYTYEKTPYKPSRTPPAPVKEQWIKAWHYGWVCRPHPRPWYLKNNHYKLKGSARNGWLY